MSDASERVESASATGLSVGSQMILILVVFIMTSLWTADHVWLRGQVSACDQALSEAKAANAELRVNIAKLQQRAVHFSGFDRWSQLDELRKAGAAVRLDVVAVAFPEKLPTPTKELIEELSRFPHLQSLAIRSPGLTSRALRPITELASLRYIFLTGDCLVDADSEVIKILNDLPILQSIELADASLGDEVFCQIAQKETMRLVSLPGSAVNDHHIEMLANCKQLEKLYLLDTLITDQSTPFLSQMQRLKELSLPANISPEAEKQLSESLPECSVFVER